MHFSSIFSSILGNAFYSFTEAVEIKYNEIINFINLIN